MNNKGQVLAIFVIVLPILLFVLTFIIDLGFLYIEKRSISNVTYDAIEYYLNNISDDSVLNDTEKLINKNMSNTKITIQDTESSVLITVIKKRKNIYNVISKENEIKVTYKGFKTSKKIIKG